MLSILCIHIITVLLLLLLLFLADCVSNKAEDALSASLFSKEVLRNSLKRGLPITPEKPFGAEAKTKGV